MDKRGRGASRKLGLTSRAEQPVSRGDVPEKLPLSTDYSRNITKSSAEVKGLIKKDLEKAIRPKGPGVSERPGHRYIKREWDTKTQQWRYWYKEEEAPKVTDDEKELLGRNLIRPVTQGIGRRSGWWQFRHADRKFTVADSKESAIKQAKSIWGTKSEPPKPYQRIADDIVKMWELPSIEVVLKDEEKSKGGGQAVLVTETISIAGKTVGKDSPNRIEVYRSGQGDHHALIHELAHYIMRGRCEILECSFKRM